MRRMMKVMLLLTVICVGMIEESVASEPFPRLTWRPYFYVATKFKSLKQGCCEGFGLCFMVYVGFSTDNIPLSEKEITLSIGKSLDEQSLIIAVPEERLEYYENGAFVSKFKDQSEVVFDEPILLPPDLISDMDLPFDLTFTSRRYRIQKQDGSYLIVVPLNGKDE